MIRSLIWPANIGKQDGNYKLDRIKNALVALGEPQLKIPFPIHIVGTNGKGSTTAFLESILKEAGFKSHVYTSPNLICLNERIKLAGVEISDAQLIEVIEKTRNLLREKGLEWEVSFFEGFTAAAFLAFSQTKADFSLIEAGLGGRFDATNVLNSKLSILTSVSFDHTEFLGHTIKEIALEKLAVARPGVPFIISHQKYEEVYDYAPQNSLYYGRDYLISIEKESFTYNSDRWNLTLKTPALLGEHQFYNAATAIKACEVLNFKYGFKITPKNIEEGLKNAKWPARMQRLSSGKIHQMFPNLEVYLDGAHNEGGLKAVLDWFLSKFPNAHIICGFLQRKELEKITPRFLGVKNLHTINIHSSENSRSAEELALEFGKINLEVASKNEFFYQTLEEINQSAAPKEQVLILGSLYLAGEVLEWDNSKNV